MRVLTIVHGFPPHGTGGAELYAEAVSQALAAGHGDAVFVFTREAVPSAGEYRVRDEARGPLRVRWVNRTFRDARAFEDTYRNDRVAARAAEYVDLIAPDVAHVHHLTCLSTTILDALAARGVPIVLHLHDYWLFCHRGQLLDTDLARCDGPGAGGCARCPGVEGQAPRAGYGAARLIGRLARHLPGAGARLRAAARHAGATLLSPDRARQLSRERLQHMQARFAHVSVAVAPSAHVRDRFAREGFPADRIVVSEYGVTAAGGSAVRRPGAPLHVGYLGALMASKAPHLIAEAVAMMPPGAVRASIYGSPSAYHGDDSYVRALDSRLDHPAVTRHGPLPHAEVGAALAALDALVFPSIWEETSGIGAREALSAGVPVVASRIGGVPEFIRHDVNGLLFEPGNATDLARQLLRLVDEPDLLPRLRAGITPLRTLDDDVRDTRARYEMVAASRRRRGTRRNVAAVVLNYGTPEETALAVSSLQRSNQRPTLVVVDNGDGRACGDALQPIGASGAVRATGANLGFAGGANVGIQQALDEGADAVLLVNSDVWLPPDATSRLLDELCRDASVGVVGPVVRSRAWPGRVVSAGIDYDPRTGRVRSRTSAAGTAPVAAVSGCAMLVRRAVFESVGLLPEGYFFAFEDIAFCQRARAAGFEVRVVPGVTAYHQGGATMGTHADRLYYAARNHLRLGRETPARSAAHAALRQGAIAGYNLAHSLTADGATLGSRLAAVVEGMLDHWRGRDGRR